MLYLNIFKIGKRTSVWTSKKYQIVQKSKESGQIFVSGFFKRVHKHKDIQKDLDNIQNDSQIYKLFNSKADDSLFFLNFSSRSFKANKMVLFESVTARKAAFLERSIKMIRQVNQLVITRKPKMCNFIDYKDYKIVYKRYASLYFITIVDKADNELIILELIHSFVEVLDKYFGNVCELDLIFNFHKTYFILDELLIAGYVSQSNRKVVLKDLEFQKQLFDEKETDKKK